MGGGVGGGVGFGGFVGSCVGASDGGRDGSTDAEADGGAEAGGHGAAATPVDGSGVGASNDGFTPLGSAVGTGKHDGVGTSPTQPWPSTMPHELPYGLNAPL